MFGELNTIYSYKESPHTTGKQLSRRLLELMAEKLKLRQTLLICTQLPIRTHPTTISHNTSDIAPYAMSPAFQQCGSQHGK
jgi:hypothetical protein